MDTLFNGIVELLGKETVGYATFLFQIIVNQLQGLLAKVNSNNMIVHEFRAYPIAYPLMKKVGLAIVYFNLYLERLPIYKDNSLQEQIVMICAYKIVGIPKPEKP